MPSTTTRKHHILQGCTVSNVTYCSVYTMIFNKLALLTCTNIGWNRCNCRRSPVVIPNVIPERTEIFMWTRPGL